jgi:hypothetical protein
MIQTSGNRYLSFYVRLPGSMVPWFCNEVEERNTARSELKKRGLGTAIVRVSSDTRADICEDLQNGGEDPGLDTGMRLEPADWSE